MKTYSKELVATMLFGCLTLFGCATNDWPPKDMSSQRGLNISADLRRDSAICGFMHERCKFELNYFYGRDEAVRGVSERPRYILYIPGGPGDIVDRNYPPLDYWREGKKIYFDVRGSGLSTIPESNAYDKFLRAEYVADDIEALRREIFKRVQNECTHEYAKSRHDGFSLENDCVLGSTAWDAIYAHSWGTVVAQIYAWKYGQSVKKLILSSPVSRSVADPGAARRTMIVNNLMSIYETYKEDSCLWPSEGELAKKMSGKGTSRHPVTDNFCFLQPQQKDLIEKRLTWLLYHIEREYGSSAFVARAYQVLRSEDSNFRQRYRYPVEFFKALRHLEWFGSAQDKGFRFESFVKQSQIDAAFFVGYYLLLKDKPPLSPKVNDQPRFECDMNSPFLETIPRRDDSDLLRRIFCHRIGGVESGLWSESVDSSFRAWAVFGVYDGIARWISQLLEPEGYIDVDGCFREGVIQDIANGSSLSDRAVFRGIAQKIGRGIEDKICPWNPARYRHEVETLILTGNADPVTAGGQAMDFYLNGLTPGKRAIIVFPKAGHEMKPQISVEYVINEFAINNDTDRQPSDEQVAEKIEDNFLSFLDRFLDRTVGQFVEDKAVRSYRDNFGAKLLPCKPEVFRIPEKNVC